MSILITPKIMIGVLLVGGIPFLLTNCGSESTLREQITDSLKKTEVERADAFLLEEPITVTASHCERSAGNLHDFYSEGDYWWPDPENPDGPYIHKDGQSNPNNFSEHRHAMIHFSEVVSTLTSAWLVTGKKQYANRGLVHLNAWFVDTATMMNPNMLYAQAISGRFTGRGIGLIDAYHLVEVVQSIKILTEKEVISPVESKKIKNWFKQFLTWMTTHQYGIDEMNTTNNHATCWVATASSMATLVGDQKIIDQCMERFKTIILPNQMAEDGSFPRELGRTKPYGYSLFNMDALCNVAQILSTTKNNLWEFEAANGRSLKKGMEFIFPYIKDKSKWPYPKDIYIWDEWPERQSFLLFAGLAYNNAEYINTYLIQKAYPLHPEVIRNLPVRHPIIWIMR